MELQYRMSMEQIQKLIPQNYEDGVDAQFKILTKVEYVT